jgi:hypothetical protein
MITKTNQAKERMMADCVGIWGVGQVKPIMTPEAFEAAWSALPKEFSKAEWIEAARGRG